MCSPTNLAADTAHHDEGLLVMRNFSSVLPSSRVILSDGWRLPVSASALTPAPAKVRSPGFHAAASSYDTTCSYGTRRRNPRLPGDAI